MKFVVMLCEFSGIMGAPWRDNGYRVISVDFEASPISDFHVQCDVLTLPYDFAMGASFVACFPPCTFLTNARVGGWKSLRPDKVGLAFGLADHCRSIAETSGAPWMVENPPGALSNYWGVPSHSFHPYEFGGYEGGAEDGYSKRTCLWTGGGFVFPDRKPIPIDDAKRRRIANMGEQKHRAAIRSLCPRGFARAVYEVNHAEGNRPE